MGKRLKMKRVREGEQGNEIVKVLKNRREYGNFKLQKISEAFEEKLCIMPLEKLERWGRGEIQNNKKNNIKNLKKKFWTQPHLSPTKV